MIETQLPYSMQANIKSFSCISLSCDLIICHDVNSSNPNPNSESNDKISQLLYSLANAESNEPAMTFFKNDIPKICAQTQFDSLRETIYKKQEVLLT